MPMGKWSTLTTIKSFLRSHLIRCLVTTVVGNLIRERYLLQDPWKFKLEAYLCITTFDSNALSAHLSKLNGYAKFELSTHNLASMHHTIMQIQWSHTESLRLEQLWDISSTLKKSFHSMIKKNMLLFEIRWVKGKACLENSSINSL